VNAFLEGEASSRPAETEIDVALTWRLFQFNWLLLSFSVLLTSNRQIISTILAAIM
jgi:hypothetical protein